MGSTAERRAHPAPQHTLPLGGPKLEETSLNPAALPDQALSWLCVAAALGTLWPALRLLSVIWSRSEYLAHGYLIPAVAAGLVYTRRSDIARALRTPAPPASGPAWVLLAALWESAALAGEVSTAAGLGIPAVLAATAYALGGRALLGALRLPVGFLLFMVPPPGFVQDRLLIELKSFVMQSSVYMLQAWGYTVTATGNRLLLPGQELFVANACSGLTSIVTLMPLGVVIAYFLSHGWARRLLIVSSIVPVAILTNIMRVTVTVAMVSRLGGEAARGSLHEGLGVLTFVLGTATLLGLSRVLR